MVTPKPNPPRLQEPYVSNKDNPYFDSPLEGHGFTSNASSQERIISQNTFQSTSDYGDVNIRNRKSVSKIINKDTEPQIDDSGLDIIFEPFERSSSGRWLKGGKTLPFAFPTILSNLNPDVGDFNNRTSKREPETFQEYHTTDKPARPWTEKSFSVKKRKDDFSGVSLPQSAASFYNGWSPMMEVAESCESFERLNAYLKSKRDDVNAGVPGRFLHVVIGKDVSDVGSVASTITYAFYLNETHKYDEYCTVPVINMKRADLNSHPELKWLLDSCQIDWSSLIFVDEIDLSYYELFGSLKIVLLNRSKLPAKQEALKEAVVEIFNCSKDESIYPWVENITIQQDCSCCTLIAEKFSLVSPEILAGKRFSRLLLAGILLDSGNLNSPHCTSKDKYMTTLLINGAGRFGYNGFYQILKYKMYNASSHGVIDIVLKDFKKWTRGTLDNSGMRLTRLDLGMSSIGISIAQFLSQEVNSNKDIQSFLSVEKLQLLVIVSGYYDARKNFKREILAVADSLELMQKLLVFLNTDTSQSQLPLKVLHQTGLTDEIRAFEINKIASRRTIERLLEEFCRIC
ncbi:exopolyphosphatase PRUNE1-like isoform X2 [Momordica charantia]|uniref:Exopolyphosphatase PRUNE1-like isoform X2 n=1 Tax=Momordica charantia TaxID=3673 RepID=A0A6J1CXV5_MOMCH|nr:exopolyphosphatase PRUNE1-like isoform X2 [Momordica charantia]